MSRTLILGGGFGGIAAAVELKGLLGDRHEVVLVDREEGFAMGLRKLWELVGHATIADGSRSRELLGRHGIEVVRGEVTAIDPTRRSAVVDGRPLTGDHLLLALGAVSRPDLVRGLAEHGHDVWSRSGARAAARALAAFRGGRVVVLVAGAPYPCPPAPFECALHVDEHLRTRGLRGGSEIEVVTVQPLLMPNAGREGSAWMAGRLAAREISSRTAARVVAVEDRVLRLEDGDIPFDLLLAVPPHRVPEVVSASGLTAEHGWIPVDGRTLATRHPGVFAVGDATLIVLANGLPLPKAGIVAERQGARVAAAIAAELRGESEPAPFDGAASCWVEMGPSVAARIDGEFYASPEPRLTIAQPDPRWALEKREFERARLERWFGG